MRRLRSWLLRGVLLGSALVLAYVAASVAYVHRHEHEIPSASAPQTGRFDDVDGVAVFSQAHGPADGVPVLLVHGTAAWSGTWFGLIPALERAGHRVIAVDLPPFGYSDKSIAADFSRTAQAKRLLAVLDRHGVDRAVVIGHSFGGGPALELALAAPMRVQRLVLVDAALGLDAAPPDPSAPTCRALGVAPLRHALLAATATNPLWSRRLLGSFVARKEAITAERLAQYRRPSSLQGATAALGAWGYRFACVPEAGLSARPAQIGALRPPLTLLWGADDTVTPLAQAERLRALVPGSRLRVIAGVGHIPHIENPAVFEASLLEALRTLPAAP